MCGIFAYIFNNGLDISLKRNKEILNAFIKTKHRGPENSIIKNMDLGSRKVILGFHRLSIMDKSDMGNQPTTLLQYPHLTLICNGEIYNYKQLAIENNFSLETGCDCKIVSFQKYGIEETAKQLDGVFAFCIWNSITEEMFVARDPLGIRSLYMSCRRWYSYFK